MSKAYSAHKARSYQGTTSLPDYPPWKITIPSRERSLGNLHSSERNSKRLTFEPSLETGFAAAPSWIEKGEKPSEVASPGLEKTRLHKTFIPALRDSNGNKQSDPTAMREIARSFYSDLYTATPTNRDAQDRLLANITSSLSPADQMSCEGLLSPQETATAAAKAPGDKSPGPDGLPAEFFQTFSGTSLALISPTWRTKHTLLGYLPDSLRVGYITLVPKKGDLESIVNWRPVTGKTRTRERRRQGLLTGDETREKKREQRKTKKGPAERQ